MDLAEPLNTAHVPHQPMAHQVGFYDCHIAPRLLHAACAYYKVAKQRALVVPEAEGLVVELGFGSGHNLAFYDPGKVKAVIAVDSSPTWLDLGRRNLARSPVPVTPILGDVQSVSIERSCADTVVFTYTLCSVARTEAMLAEARRILKPSGKLLFVEHGAAPDARVASWQRRLSPLTTRFAGGCRLVRNTEELIWDAGFGFDRLEYHWVSRMPRTAAFHYIGAARIR